ncbi:nuclear transport factor 2 family protein [Aquipuribacter hungaricus]|uniref:Nuclear transport factor 2 family protein n=1 Tax=Aquipuribacter hungaricus TaxID=545624 RepID=A0ABV7WMP5_9MICO
MVTIEDLAARLEQVETQLALHRLAADYCIGADQEDLERFAGVWTDGALWDAAGDDLEDDEEHRFHGLEAILAAVRGQWATFSRMQHATTNHVVDRDTDDLDQAVGRCDVVVTVQLPDGRWVVGGGVYEDHYQRRDGVWRIASRTVRRPFDLAPLDGHGGARVPAPDLDTPRVSD